MNNMKNYNVRELDKSNYLDYRKIRLELLLDNKESFGSSYEEESLFNDEFWMDRLSKENVHTIGAYVGVEIIGIIVLVKNVRRKMKHIAHINSMYVKPSFRNQGVAYSLLKYAENIATAAGVERLNLSVVDSNINAIKLYQKFGFIEYGIEPDTIKVDSNYYSLKLMSKKI
jgi:ribosomal protein S18 acetylase RimI-like enzyme